MSHGKIAAQYALSFPWSLVKNIYSSLSGVGEPVLQTLITTSPTTHGSSSNATIACYKALVKKNPKVCHLHLSGSPAADMITAHQTLGAYRVRNLPAEPINDVYTTQRQAKIALKVSSEEELLELEAIAKSLNLCARCAQDR
jgi:peptidyl-tRNA hydrolase